MANKKIMLTHSMMEMKSHTAWEEIVSYGRFITSQLDLRNTDVMTRDYPGFKKFDSPAHKYTPHYETYHRLIVFCSGEIKPEIMNVSQNYASQIVSVVQDLSWPGVVVTNSRYVLVPFANLDLAREVMTDRVKNFNPGTMELLYTPFGAIGNFDSRRLSTYRGAQPRKIERLDSSIATYLGSFKKDRLETILREYPERFNFVGRATRADIEQEFGNKYDVDRVNVVGWVDPRLSWAVYSQSSGALLPTDEMTSLGLEYNRPYDLMHTRSRVILLGEHVRDFKRQYPVTDRDYISQNKLTAKSKEMLRDTRARDSFIYRA